MQPGERFLAAVVVLVMSILLIMLSMHGAQHWLNLPISISWLLLPTALGVLFASIALWFTSRSR